MYGRYPTREEQLHAAQAVNDTGLTMMDAWRMREANQTDQAEQAAAGQDPEAWYNQLADGDDTADMQAAAQYAQVLSDYTADIDAEMDLVRDAYTLSETPEERAVLEQQLADLTSQRSALSDLVANGFAEAQGAIGGIRGQAAAATDATVADLAGTYDDALAQIAASNADRVQGLGANNTADMLGLADIESSADARDIEALTASAGARQQALARNLGDLTTGEIDQIAAMAGVESQAGQTFLRLAAQAQEAQARQAHQRQVLDRMAADRRAMNSELAALRGRKFDASTMMQEAQLEKLAQGGGGVTAPQVNALAQQVSGLTAPDVEAMAESDADRAQLLADNNVDGGAVRQVGSDLYGLVHSSYLEGDPSANDLQALLGTWRGQYEPVQQLAVDEAMRQLFDTDDLRQVALRLSGEAESE